MASTISTSIPNLLDPAMAEIFMDGAIRLADLSYTQFARVRPATTKTIEKTGYNPPSTYSPHVESADFNFLAVVQGNKKTYTMAEIALAAQISAFSNDFLDRTIMLEYAQQFGLALSRKLASNAIAVLSGGFSDVGPDGAALFSTAHTAASGGNQSNTGTSALSEAALQAALVQQRVLKGPDGQLVGSMPTLLLVSPTKEFAAKELVGSTLSGADMQINVLGTKGLQVVVLPELEAGDNDDWYLVDPMMYRQYQYVSRSSSPKQWIDPDSDNWRISDRVSTADGYDAWRGVFGSNVA